MVDMVDNITTITVQEIEGNEQESAEKENKDETIRPSCWNMLHLITIIGASSLTLSTQLLIPRHNSIYYPNYWFEVPLLISFVASFGLTMRYILECVTFTKERSIVTLSVGMKMFACISVPVFSCFIVSRVYWTSLMGLQHPMPFVGVLGFFVGWFLLYCLVSVL